MAKTMGIGNGERRPVFRYFGPYPYKHLSVTSLPISYATARGGRASLLVVRFLFWIPRNATPLAFGINGGHGFLSRP